MTRCYISSVFLVLFAALLFLAGCGGGPHYDPVPHPPCDAGYAYTESDGDIRLEISGLADWKSITSFQIWRTVLGEARGRTTSEYSLIGIINSDDVVVWGDKVILYDTTATNGYLYTYKIVMTAGNTTNAIMIYNGQAPLMQLEGVGPYVPPPVMRVTAPPALITEGHATLYWYMPGESIVEPPVSAYAMPSYVTSFEVEMEVNGSWTTVMSGIGKNVRSVQVPVPELNTTDIYTIRAVSSQLGCTYPLEALSPSQYNQVVVNVGVYCY